MSKIVTCCVCGSKVPLSAAVSVGYSTAGWPVQVPMSLYACKDGPCRIEDAKAQAGAPQMPTRQNPSLTFRVRKGRPPQPYRRQVNR